MLGKIRKLCGRNLAKLGSKCLHDYAFLPDKIISAQAVEKLYRLKWGKLDGLGALIISPTRELAMQIFDELRKVGAKHDLSAGLLIGGKNVKEEQGRINGESLMDKTMAQSA